MHLCLYPLALSLRKRAICFTSALQKEMAATTKSWMYRDIFLPSAFFCFCFILHIICVHDHEKGWKELHAVFSDGVI